MKTSKFKAKISHIFKKHKFLLRSIAVTLVLALLFTSLPMDGIIALAEQAIEDSKLITVVEELEEYRTEFSKTYLKSDGTLEAVVSSNPIHFNEDGEWVEIDSTLETAENEKGEEILQNKKGSFNVELPAELQNSSEIAIEKGENKISIKLLETKKSKAKKNKDKKEKSEKLTKAQRKRMTAGELFEADNNQSSAVEYTSAYNDTNIRYDVTPNEVKESIVLQKAPNKKATYSYEITADGLTAVLNEDNSIDFFEVAKSKDAEPVFSMPAPHMFDSNDVYSYDIETTLQNKKGKYILTYKPSYEWLKSKERAYPVTVDPTVTVNSGIQDSYTFSGEGYKDSYTGYEQQLKVGTTAWLQPNDYWQTYLKFTDLPQIPYEDYRIDSAYLMLTPKATTGNWEEMELGVYELTEDWKNHQTGKVAERITFNNAPEDVGYSTATATVARGGADNGVGVGFEIAHIMEKWYENPEENFGIKLAAHLEDNQYNDNLVFHSSRSTTGTAPYLSLTYTEYVPVTGIEIIGKPENNKIFIDETLSLTITTTPENASDKADVISNVVWSSDNPDIAEIDSVTGDVIAKTLGTTTISAISGEYSTSFVLTVREHIPDEIYLMISDNYRLFEHEQYYLRADTFYQNSGVYAEVEYHSNNPEIVSISENGIITANSVGTAVITVSAKENPMVTATTTITVIPIQSAEIVNLPENNSLDVYKSHQLDLEITADNYSAIEGDPAFIGRYANFFEWNSSNPDVAIVDEYGTIYPYTTGTTVISVSRPNGGEVLDSFTLTVYYIEATDIEITNYPEDNKLVYGEEFYLSAEISPDNASDYFTAWTNMNWSSSNTDVISIDSYYGIITAVGYGTSTITVEYEGLTDSIEITVPYYPTTEVGFIFSDSPHSLYIDDTVSFWGIVAPSNATDQRTRCTSSNPNVVSVVAVSDTTSPDKTVSYQLKAMSVGTATIRLEAYNDPTVYDEITVAVNWRDSNYEYDLTEDYILFGNSKQILTPGGAEYIASIEDTSIISTDGNGKITALKTGTTKITIGTYGVIGAKPHECTITVLSYADFEFFNLTMVDYGETCTMTKNTNVELRTEDADKIEIVGSNKIKAIDIGWVSVDVYYRGVCIHTIDFYVIESIAIVNKPEDNIIHVGETYESLAVKQMPTDIFCEAEWSSSDESIAEIYYDYVRARVVLTGISEGSVWISAKSSDMANPSTDGFWLYVDLVPVKSFTIVNNPDHSTFANGIGYLGDVCFLKAVITPDDPNVYYNEIDWYVSKGDASAVIFRDSLKGTAKLIIDKAGTYEISATIDGIPSTNKYTITVKKPDVSITKKPTNGIAGENTYILKDGTTHQLGASIIPSDLPNVTYKWSPETSNIATVDENGKITTNAEGTVQITVRAYKNGLFLNSASFTLRVIHIDSVFIDGIPNVNLTVGETYNLTAQVYPYYSYTQGVTWSLSFNSTLNSNKYADLDANGNLKLKAAGTITVYAKSKIDSTKYFPLEIVIYPKANGITITNLPENNTLYVGETHQLGYTISPADALQNVEWDIVGDDIVDISANGKITARKAGNTKIKAYAENNPSVCYTIDLAISLTQKSYIFYNDYNETDEADEKIDREVELNQKILAYKYYGGDTTKVKLKPVISASDFKQQWNDAMDDILDYAIVITHGTPEGLIRFNDAYGQNYFDDLNDWLLAGNTGTPYNVTEEKKNAHLLNGDIKGLEKKTMKGLVLLSCNGGHLDYVNTPIGNVAMAFSEVVKGAPVIAADGTVHVSEKISNEFNSIEKYKNSTIYEKVYDSFARYIDGNNREFEQYSRKGREASGISNVARETNTGWVIYKKVNGNIIYNDIPYTHYKQGDYTPTMKTFTFSKLLEFIHS